MTSHERAPETVSAHSAVGEATAGTVRAWDVPTRLFHWVLAILIGLAWVSHRYGDDALLWHKWNGYAILILVVFRILWGFVGSSTARFSAFAYNPLTALKYGFDFLLRRPRYFLSHNPLGGTMVYILLLVIAAQATIGLFSYDDHTRITGGPLAGTVSEDWVAFLTSWHVRIFDYIMILVAIHIAANVIHLVWKRENLVKSMITGRKPRRPFEDGPEAEFCGPVLALFCLVLAAAIVLGGIWLATGRL